MFQWKAVGDQAICDPVVFRKKIKGFSKFQIKAECAAIIQFAGDDLSERRRDIARWEYSHLHKDAALAGFGDGCW